MEGYSRERHLEAGYEFVNSPHITKAALFETSGHLEWYADGMFPPMHVDADVDPETGHVRRQGQDYYLKPMNCPFHNLIFQARGGRTASFRCGCSSSAPCTGTRSPASSMGSPESVG